MILPPEAAAGIMNMANLAYQRLKDTKALPSPTGVALEILRLASDENATADQVAAVVQSDPATSARLLKLVNSPLAGVPRKIASLPVAIKLLGIRTVKNLAPTFSLVTNNRKGRCHGFDYEAFWSNSLARAVAARSAARHLRSFVPDEAFAIALLSKIGQLAFATVHPEEYTRALNLAGAGDPHRLREIEREMFELDHNELSAEMMSDWRLQDFFCQAVRAQDAVELRKPECGSRVEQLARTLHLAGSVARVMVQSGVCRDSLDVLVQEAEGLGISSQALHQLFNSASEEWCEVGTILSVATRGVPPLEDIRRRAPVEPSGVAAGGAAPETGVAPAECRKDALRVLIVDDDPLALRLLEKHLAAGGYQVATARNGAEALNIDLVQAPQMIITDWMMPEMDGLELCRRLRAHEGLGFVYIIIVTAHTDKDRVVEALDAGADDCLTKPYSRQELLARVRAGERLMRLEADLAGRSREVSQFNAQLAAANEKLRLLATTDVLSGLINRREALARLAESWSVAVRYGDPLSCLMVDIDRFKDLNDTCGHAVGDLILKATADTLRKSSRAGEVVGRIGGEEFLMICPRATARAAAAAAERLRAAVEANVVESDGRRWSVTISLGVAERSEGMGCPDDLLRAADGALYAAKHSGRNRVCVSGESGTDRPSDSSQRSTSEVSLSPPEGDPMDSPIKALVVDHDADARALCCGILRRAGHEVTEAGNGPDALGKIGRCSPEVILVAARLPRLDGLEFTRRLKADPATQQIPVIMLAAPGAGDDIAAGRQAGVDEYLSKPLKHDELVLRVGSMALLYRSRMELMRSNEIRGEQARALYVLLDLSCSLVAAETLDAILEKTVAAVAELTCSRRVAIMMPAQDGTGLNVAKALGVEEHVAAALRVPVGGAIAGQVFRRGDRVVLNTLEEVERVGERCDAAFFAGAPLMSRAMRVGDRVVGVLNITGRQGGRPFSGLDLEYVDFLCNMAASTIDDRASHRTRDEARNAVVVALATLAEKRDIVTGRHLERVTKYALLLADELRKSEPFRAEIDDAFLQDLRRAMPLHDIGKVAIPDHILLKPDKLTSAEMTIMRRHAELGARTLRVVIDRAPGACFLRMAEQIAHGHHEWYNGHGYPRGITGDETPLPARIAGLADVYDALTTERPYKSAVSTQEAGQVIRAGSGSQFDPAVVEAFLRREQQFAQVAAELADEAALSEPLDAVDGELRALQQRAHDPTLSRA